MQTIKRKQKKIKLILVALVISSALFLISGIGVNQSIASRNMQIAQGQKCPERCCKYGDQYYPVGYRIGQLICKPNGKWERGN